MIYFLRTKTKPYWYVCEFHGVLFVTWVSEKEKERALEFAMAKKKAEVWEEYIKESTGVAVIVVEK